MELRIKIVMLLQEGTVIYNVFNNLFLTVKYLFVTKILGIKFIFKFSLTNAKERIIHNR